ncbi:MAG: adenylyltransferase/cytidyltransferase family protein [Endomicrobium sp.]|jgi:D-beta-D-heptose 7-phosphate kinase/D-beta-D-heptose 1-phosphate adenosyltransferase|nr:adenylyltransferase/cytidyltransferase family protein [Endomicrobium sp.]
MKYLESQSRVLSRKELQVKIRKLQKDGKKVVFTNGCFDLIHTGHTSLFKRAKSLGDILVVAINSDSSLSYIKGSKRPLIGEKDRAELIISLRFVDYVVIFNEETPREILSELRPDILVKGGDYELSEIIGKEYVKEVYRVPLLKGKSTTSLIGLILDRYGSRG